MATWAMKQRYAWIDQALAEGRPFGRRDLVEKFFITTQTATATLNEYRALNPGKLAFDKAAKVFVRDDQHEAAEHEAAADDEARERQYEARREIALEPDHTGEPCRSAIDQLMGDTEPLEETSALLACQQATKAIDLAEAGQ